MFVYIGTYTSGASEGIYVYRLDMATGALAPDSAVTDKANPSFLTMDPSGRYLYAVNELADYGGQPSGAVTAYAVHPATGRLSLLNRHPSQGAAPCYISLDPTGRYALVANYVGGSVAVLPIGPDGTLGPATDTVPTLPDTYPGPNTGADIHLHPSGRFLYASNRGHDSIVIYQVDAGTGRLTLVGHESTRSRTPRGFALDPSGQFLLAANQESGSVVTFRIDQQSGALTFTGQVAAVPSPVCLQVVA